MQANLTQDGDISLLVSQAEILMLKGQAALHYPSLTPIERELLTGQEIQLYLSGGSRQLWLKAICEGETIALSAFFPATEGYIRVVTPPRSEVHQVHLSDSALHDLIREGRCRDRYGGQSSKVTVYVGKSWDELPFE